LAATRNKRGVVSRLAVFCGLLAFGMVLVGCSSGDAVRRSPKYTGPDPIPKGGGQYKVGKPYKIGGRWYHPKEDPSYDRTGTASWYGPNFHRHMTANGEWFDQDHLTAAHPTLPLPTYARVTNLENGRQIIVRVNDRGPYAHDRIIDLSKRSAEVLGFKNKGTARVRVQYVGKAPINDDGRHLMAMNRQLHDGGSPRVMMASMEKGRADANRRPASTSATQARMKQPTGQAPVQQAQATMAAAAPLPESGRNVPTGTQSDTIGTWADGGVYIQAAAFSDFGNARKAEARLSAFGRVEVTPVTVGARTLYRVRVGPLPDDDAANRTLARVMAAGHADARIVTN